MEELEKQLTEMGMKDLDATGIYEVSASAGGGCVVCCQSCTLFGSGGGSSGGSGGTGGSY